MRDEKFKRNGQIMQKKCNNIELMRSYRTGTSTYTTLNI